MKKVIVTVEILCMPISIILLYKFIELVSRYKLNYLGEYKFTLIYNLDASEQQD